MSEPDKRRAGSAEQTPHALTYAGPGPKRPPGFSAVDVGFAAAGIGGLGLFAVIRNGDPLAFLVILFGALIAIICSSIGLIWPEQGERRWPAAVGLAFGLLLMVSLTSPLGRFGMHYPSRPASASVRCTANLRQIGAAVVLYANAHGGRLPGSLAQLHVTSRLPAEVFVCPASAETRATGATTRQVMDEIGESAHCSYTYHGAGLSTPISPRFVVAIERGQNHNGTGRHVLFGDGHVERIDAKTVAKVLAELAAGQNPPPSLSPQPATGRSP